jgi:GNAT superfamily N-acetyltransferase
MDDATPESTTTSWRLRVANADDPRDVADLATLRFRWRAIERDEVGLSAEEYRDALGRWMYEHAASHVGFIGNLNDEAVAMAWLAIVDRVPGPGHFVRTCAYVQSVYVVPEARDRGLGSALMAEVVRHGRLLGLDYLAVHPSERSFPFYERLGFSATDRVLELDFRPRWPAA